MRKLVEYIVNEILGVVYYLQSAFRDKETGFEMVTSLSCDYQTATETCNTDRTIKMRRKCNWNLKKALRKLLKAYLKTPLTFF